ncbi:MAG TPA: hypothetical protein VG826_07010 [Pirellulales bacterium]|nr:hypothetical protein [Pirellulales bacterium]
MTATISNPVGRYFMAVDELQERLERVHLRDIIDVGLVDRALLTGLPTELASRLEASLTEQGR